MTLNKEVVFDNKGHICYNVTVQRRTGVYAGRYTPEYPYCAEVQMCRGQWCGSSVVMTEWMQI